MRRISSPRTLDFRYHTFFAQKGKTSNPEIPVKPVEDDKAEADYEPKEALDVDMP